MLEVCGNCFIFYFDGRLVELKCDCFYIVLGVNFGNFDMLSRNLELFIEFIYGDILFNLKFSICVFWFFEMLFRWFLMFLSICMWFFDVRFLLVVMFSSKLCVEEYKVRFWGFCMRLSGWMLLISFDREKMMMLENKCREL